MIYRWAFEDLLMQLSKVRICKPYNYRGNRGPRHKWMSLQKLDLLSLTYVLYVFCLNVLDL